MPENLDLGIPTRRAVDINDKVNAKTQERDVIQWGKFGGDSGQFVAPSGTKVCSSLFCLEGEYLSDEEISDCVKALIAVCPRIKGFRIAQRVEMPDQVMSSDESPVVLGTPVVTLALAVKLRKPTDLSAE